MTSPDFAAEGLLDGLDGVARASLLRLLEELYHDGVPLAELRRAVGHPGSRRSRLSLHSSHKKREPIV